jgi:hypothetical protein
MARLVLALALLLSFTPQLEAQGRDTVQQIFPDTLAARSLADSTRGIRLCSAGDVTLGSNLDSLWARSAAANLWTRYARFDHPDSLLSPLRGLFADADVVMINVEGAIGEGPLLVRKCGPRSTSCYAFRSPSSSAGAIRRLGAENARVVGNVANNHSHDAGGPGLDTTIALLDSAGVHVTGADTLATPVVTHRGDTIAFLGFYTGSDSPSALNLAGVRRHVARAAESYGTVVVTMHLGAEGPTAQRTRNVDEIFVRTPRGNPVAFANAAIAGGATAVIGHGPHVLRGGEWKDSSLVLYSLGNFLNYGTFNLREPMNRGAVACMTITAPRRVQNATIVSTVQIAPGVVLHDPLGASASLIDSLSRLDFPFTGIAVAKDGAVGTRPAPPAIRKPE